mmetsp:Transcript_2008/g.5012  ORF Transcript_2008/g.5012 Transcript_2008/m.5012 type:complete len:211 (-) Transcript_2008:630-1262(-)
MWCSGASRVFTSGRSIRPVKAPLIASHHCSGRRTAGRCPPPQHSPAAAAPRKLEPSEKTFHWTRFIRAISSARGAAAAGKRCGACAVRLCAARCPSRSHHQQPVGRTEATFRNAEKPPESARPPRFKKRQLGFVEMRKATKAAGPSSASLPRRSPACRVGWGAATEQLLRPHPLAAKRYENSHFLIPWHSPLERQLVSTQGEGCFPADIM